MIKQDLLWKAIIEDFFYEFLLFYFPKLHPLVDWKRQFEVLDKELPKLYPESDEPNRRVDMLIKFWLKDGTPQAILIHVEVQGYKDENFPKRMFVYYYRASDRFNLPVMSLAILTDGNKDWRPRDYRYKFHGTALTYRFPIYKLIDHAKQKLDRSKNPWAFVMKAALLDLHPDKDDDSLLYKKTSLYRELRQAGFAVEKVKYIVHFLKYYARFSKPNFYTNFDNEINVIENKNSKNMGILDLVKNHLLEEAEEKGIEKGIEKIVLNVMRKHPEMSDQDIAEFLEQPLAVVKQVRKKLKSGSVQKDSQNNGKNGSSSK